MLPEAPEALDTKWPRVSLEAGCEVAIVGTSDSVYNTAQEFRDRGFSCHGVKGNLGERREVYRVFQECVELLGGDLDILLTAHGIQRRTARKNFQWKNGMK